MAAHSSRLSPFVRLLFTLGVAAQVHGANPKLYVQETDHVKVVYYDPAHEYLVQHLIRSFENALAFDQRLFQYHPTEKVGILLEDLQDTGFGAANTVPRNYISISIEPLSHTFETLPANERISWLLNHELIHVVTGDSATQPDIFFRHLFGGKVGLNAEDPVSMLYSSLTDPRHYSPRWYAEGIAVFMETWLSGGLGRAMGGYDEMVFRAMVRDDAYIYDVVGLEAEGTAVDFQVGANSYLYGTRFMTYMADTYGPDKLIQWVTRWKDSKSYFASQFKNVYGVPLEQEWSRWVRSERAWQNENLKRIREYPVTKVEPVSKQVLGSVSRSYYDPDKKVIYAAVRYAGQMGHLAAIHTDTGAVDHLKDVSGAATYYVTSMTFDRKNQRLFYASDNLNWRDLNVLDLKTNKSHRLIRDSRIGDLVYNPVDDSLWGMRHHNGLSSLVRFTAPFQEGKILHNFEFGTDLFDLDISPDGTYLTGGMTDLSDHQKLVRFKIEDFGKPQVSYDILRDFEYNSPGNFVYSPDGKYLYGSSYYTGASNIFRYDFETKMMEVMSNAETGLFRPLPLPDGRVIAYEYNSQGFSPGLVALKPLEDVNAVVYLGQATLDKYPVLRTWKLPSSASIKVESLLTKSGRYRPQANTQLMSVYPIVQGYKDTVAVGARLDFSDRIGFADGSLTLAYSPASASNQQFHAGLQARLWNLKVTGYYNKADFYDLFGPTKTSRKGYSLKVEDLKNLRYDTPRRLDLTWSLAGYGGIDRLPDFQNVAAAHTKFLVGKVGLKYGALEKSGGAVEDEKGALWSLNTAGTYTGSKTFPQISATYDHGFLLPLKHSSMWLRGSAGKAFGNTSDPFANFYFGGFGNNWIDHLDFSRYRLADSFPGVALNAIGASSFTKGLAEWDLPPVRFRHLGTTKLYSNWSRLALFSSGLATNLANHAARDVHVNVGAQVDVRLVIFTYFSSTFSAGYAVAADRHGHTSGEYMFSLKLL